MKQFLLPLLLSILLFLPLVAADKGVGIFVTTESAIVNEGQVNCVNYSVYNPFSNDTSIYMTASDALTPFVKDTQPILVPANTLHDKAIPVSLCFNIPKVYKEDCMAGIVCQKTCGEPQVTYVGSAVAVMAKTPNEIASTAGSSTQASASAPLTLKVACVPKAMNWMPVIAIVIVIAILAGLVAMRKRKA